LAISSVLALQEMSHVQGFALCTSQQLAVCQTKSDKTASGYSLTMKQFFTCVGNKPLASIRKDDLYKFLGFLKAQELSDRTCHNRIGEVITLLRHYGFKEEKIRGEVRGEESPRLSP
jgi:hypothetical protein